MKGPWASRCLSSSIPGPMRPRAHDPRAHGAGPDPYIPLPQSSQVTARPLGPGPTAGHKGRAHWTLTPLCGRGTYGPIRCNTIRNHEIRYNTTLYITILHNMIPYDMILSYTIPRAGPGHGPRPGRALEGVQPRKDQAGTVSSRDRGLRELSRLACPSANASTNTTMRPN